MIRREASARKNLDRRLDVFRPADRLMPPGKGWIRAIRDAIGMTGMQLALRLGVKPQSVADMERSEATGTIRIDSLRRAAEALDCTLVYALVPNRSLESMVEQRARAIAREALSRVGHTMSLEDQAVADGDAEARLDDYIRDHVRLRDLWAGT